MWRGVNEIVADEEGEQTELVRQDAKDLGKELHVPKIVYGQ